MFSLLMWKHISVVSWEDNCAELLIDSLAYYDFVQTSTYVDFRLVELFFLQK